MVGEVCCISYCSFGYTLLPKWWSVSRSEQWWWRREELCASSSTHSFVSKGPLDSGPQNLKLCDRGPGMFLAVLEVLPPHCVRALRESECMFLWGQPQLSLSLSWSISGQSTSRTHKSSTFKNRNCYFFSGVWETQTVGHKVFLATSRTHVPQVSCVMGVFGEGTGGAAVTGCREGKSHSFSDAYGKKPDNIFRLGLFVTILICCHISPLEV